MSHWRSSALNHPALERFSHCQPRSFGRLQEGALGGEGLMLPWGGQHPAGLPAAGNALD